MYSQENIATSKEEGRHLVESEITFIPSTKYISDSSVQLTSVFSVVGSLNCLCISSSALKHYFSVRFEKIHFVAGLQDYCLSFATLISL